MPSLRYNPLLDTYTMVATNRQDRPHLSSEPCAFCPGEGKTVPNSYTVLAYPNDYAVLSQQPEIPNSDRNNSPYHSLPAYGKCEVILYSSDHYARLYDLPHSQVLAIVQLWAERYVKLSKDKKIKYIYEFENRGEEVGVTMLHPHGQLYAYSWIPAKIKTELDQCKRYYKKNGRNLFADMNATELNERERMVIENDSFLAYIPHFTDYPYGVFIVSRALKPHLAAFSLQEQSDLAQLLSALVRGMDAIYDRPFPYMMCLHQTPVNSPKYKDSEAYYAFHIEFYPPLRSAHKMKYYAGSEMGAGAAANPLAVEDCARILRDIIATQKV